MAGEIAAAISQANLPPQHAIEAYAYALSYSKTAGDEFGEVVFSAVASDGQLAQLFAQVRNLFRLVHAAKQCCNIRIHICPERTPRADFAFNGPFCSSKCELMWATSKHFSSEYSSRVEILTTKC